MKLENSINYYYTVLALRLLLERGLISEDEYGKICRYNAEQRRNFPPGTGVHLVPLGMDLSPGFW